MNIEKAKVSVIMPSFNVSSYIDTAVESVINQTMQEIEIICIDASSTDGTWEKIQKLAEKDKRITIIRTGVRSYGYQVNLGIKIASGEYIAILETDDFVDPHMYETLYNYTIDEKIDYVKADYKAFWTQKNRERVYLYRKNLEDNELYNKVICPKNYSILGENDWYLWTGIYNKNFIINNSIFLTESNGAAFQDIGFLIKTLQYASTAIYINTHLYNYCIDREGSSSNQKTSLYFAFNEYKENINIVRTTIAENRLFFARMAKSFICCLSEMEPVMTEKEEEYFTWFVDRLNEAINKNYIDQNIISKNLWRQLNNLLSNRDVYFECRDKNKKMILEKVHGEDKNIIIFGCGNYGYEAYKWCIKNSVNVIGFMDNNKKLWGTEIDSIPVYAPDYANNLKSSSFLVANEKYYQEIIDQLMKIGVNSKKIYRYM